MFSDFHPSLSLVVHNLIREDAELSGRLKPLRRLQADLQKQRVRKKLLRKDCAVCWICLRPSQHIRSAACMSQGGTVPKIVSGSSVAWYRVQSRRFNRSLQNRPAFAQPPNSHQPTGAGSLPLPGQQAVDRLHVRGLGSLAVLAVTVLKAAPGRMPETRRRFSIAAGSTGAEGLLCEG